MFRKFSLGCFVQERFETKKFDKCLAGWFLLNRTIWTLLCSFKRLESNVFKMGKIQKKQRSSHRACFIASQCTLISQLNCLLCITYIINERVQLRLKLCPRNLCLWRHLENISDRLFNVLILSDASIASFLSSQRLQLCPLASYVNCMHLYVCLTIYLLMLNGFLFPPKGPRIF